MKCHLLVGTLLAIGGPLFLDAAGGPVIGGCPVFPADNIWNTAVDRAPVHASSDAFVKSIGVDSPLHPDFGSGLYAGAPMGIPFNIIRTSQPHVPIKFLYRDESDLSNYPIPPNPLIEGGPTATAGDRHILMVDTESCVLWEVYAASNEGGVWQGGSGAIFDLKCNCMRPDGRTSADAAGLPIFPGLVKYDEVAAGEIRHAIRFSVPKTRNQAVWPARHVASKLADPDYPPMGLRLRLKASFDVSGFPPQAQVILRALKKYGMIVADNGQPWFISGSPDSRWDNGALAELKRVHGAEFEALDTREMFVTHHSARAKQ